MTTKIFKVEAVGFGGSIQQVSMYEEGKGTTIIEQFWGHGYEENRDMALALCAELNTKHKEGCYTLSEGGPCSCRSLGEL